MRLPVEFMKMQQFSTFMVLATFLGFTSGLLAFKGRVFATSGKTITVSTSDSSKTRKGAVLYVVANGKEVGRARVEQVFHTKIVIKLESGAAAAGDTVTDKRPVAEPAAKPAVAKVDPKIEPKVQPLPDQISPSEFLEFAGIRYGDKLERVVRLLGEPEKSDASKPGSYHHLTLSWFSGKFVAGAIEVPPNPSRDSYVAVIRISSPDAVARLRSLGVADAKLNLLGVHRDEILKRFGQPVSISSGNYEYKYTRGGQKGLVKFICYDFWQNECRQINVQWFR